VSSPDPSRSGWGGRGRLRPRRPAAADAPPHPGVCASVRATHSGARLTLTSAITLHKASDEEVRGWS
jgi:hypothetical protein